MNTEGGVSRWPEYDRPCWLKSCLYVAWGFDPDSAKLALTDHIESAHPEVAPVLVKAMGGA